MVDQFPASEFQLVRTAKAEPFHCARCDQDKKAKLTGRWIKPGGGIVVICNGCYGNILSREDR